MQAGTYRPKLDVNVIPWPLPDANGDGDPVLDDNGGEVKDAGGNVIREYDMPEGFQDLHDDGVGVKVNRRGQPVRDIDGNAITLAPGGAIVEFPDGRVKSLDADECVEFQRAYSLHTPAASADSTEPSQPPAPTSSPTTPDPTQPPAQTDPAQSDPSSGDGNSTPDTSGSTSDAGSTTASQ